MSLQKESLDRPVVEALARRRDHPPLRRNVRHAGSAERRLANLARMRNRCLKAPAGWTLARAFSVPVETDTSHSAAPLVGSLDLIRIVCFETWIFLHQPLVHADDALGRAVSLVRRPVHGVQHGVNNLGGQHTDRVGALAQLESLAAAHGIRIAVRLWPDSACLKPALGQRGAARDDALGNARVGNQLCGDQLRFHPALLVAHRRWKRDGDALHAQRAVHARHEPQCGRVQVAALRRQRVGIATPGTAGQRAVAHCRHVHAPSGAQAGVGRVGRQVVHQPREVAALHAIRQRRPLPLQQQLARHLLDAKAATDARARQIRFVPQEVAISTERAAA
eukprot:495625-Prymnesium_polylepis.2